MPVQQKIARSAIFDNFCPAFFKKRVGDWGQSPQKFTHAIFEYIFVKSLDGKTLFGYIVSERRGNPSTLNRNNARTPCIQPRDGARGNVPTSDVRIFNAQKQKNKPRQAESLRRAVSGFLFAVVFL